MKSELLKRYKNTKYFKLILSIIIDLAGFVTYFIPILGEGADFVWGPISGVLIYLLFPNRKIMAFYGAAEELVPFIDFLPTASIAWVQDYIKDNKKTLSEFIKKEVEQEQLDFIFTIKTFAK